VSNPEHRCCGVASAELDGIPVDARAIPLKDDGGVHEVTIVLGADSGLGLQSGARRQAKRVPTEKSV
jgi:cyclic beta-1,2-glucan synthetase